MNLTPRGKSALLRPRYACRSPPPSLTLPRNPLYQLKRKALSILFQPVKTFGEQREENRTRALSDLMGNHEVFCCPKSKTWR